MILLNYQQIKWIAITYYTPLFLAARIRRPCWCAWSTRFPPVCCPPPPTATRSPTVCVAGWTASPPWTEHSASRAMDRGGHRRARPSAAHYVIFIFRERSPFAPAPSPGRERKPCEPRSSGFTAFGLGGGTGTPRRLRRQIFSATCFLHAEPARCLNHVTSSRPFAALQLLRPLLDHLGSHRELIAAHTDGLCDLLA